MSETPLDELMLRQSVSTNAHACDTRFGEPALERFGHDLRLCVGKPRRCLVVASEAAAAAGTAGGVGCGVLGVPASIASTAVSAEKTLEVAPVEASCAPTGDAALSLQERVRRLVADAGFHAEAHTIATGERGVSDAARLPEYLELLAAHHLTQDDALVAVGNQAFLATWNHVAALWGQGMWYAGVATSLPALITACATPAGLTCGEVTHMVRAHTRMSLNYTAPSICAGFAAGEEQDLARALMVATAACESNESLKSLVSASEALAAGVVATTASCALEAARSRGRVVSSTSAAVRNSLAYGTTLAAALAPEVPASEGRLLAEGMRFAARLAVGMEIGQMDFVYLQDGLLARLGLHEVPFDVDPKALVDRMKALVFARKNKFMFCVPFAPGRIRPQAVEDALLLEFVTAFCDARRALC